MSSATAMLGTAIGAVALIVAEFGLASATVAHARQAWLQGDCDLTPSLGGTRLAQVAADLRRRQAPSIEASNEAIML